MSMFHRTRRSRTWAWRRSSGSGHTSSPPPPPHPPPSSRYNSPPHHPSHLKWDKWGPGACSGQIGKFWLRWIHWKNCCNLQATSNKTIKIGSHFVPIIVLTYSVPNPDQYRYRYPAGSELFGRIWIRSNRPDPTKKCHKTRNKKINSIDIFWKN